MASTLWEILLVGPTKLQYIHYKGIKIKFHKQAESLMLKLFLKTLETVKVGYFKIRYDYNSLTLEETLLFY